MIEPDEEMYDPSPVMRIIERKREKEKEWGRERYRLYSIKEPQSYDESGRRHKRYVDTPICHRLISPVLLLDQSPSHQRIVFVARTVVECVNRLLNLVGQYAAAACCADVLPLCMYASGSCETVCACHIAPTPRG